MIYDVWAGCDTDGFGVTGVQGTRPVFITPIVMIGLGDRSTE